MSTKPNKPPIIIIGMHRSGTSMVTRLLERLGLFVGQEKDTNNESIFFQTLNDWILLQAGATWDNPKPMRWLTDDMQGCDLIAEYLQSVLISRASSSYLGWWQRIRSGASYSSIGPWGWKDPRNTFTLPLWLRLFPDAKIIHFRRHGVDVAQSLKYRDSERRKNMENGFRTLGSMKSKPPVGVRVIESSRCLALEGGFSLWEEYMDAAVGQVDRLGMQAKEIAYEDFLTDPVPILIDLAEFCGLESTKPKIEKICAEINPDRAFAHRRNEAQQSFAVSVAERLKEFGY